MNSERSDVRRRRQVFFAFQMCPRQGEQSDYRRRGPSCPLDPDPFHLVGASHLVHGHDRGLVPCCGPDRARVCLDPVQDPVRVRGVPCPALCLRDDLCHVRGRGLVQNAHDGAPVAPEHMHLADYCPHVPDACRRPGSSHHGPQAIPRLSGSPRSRSANQVVSAATVTVSVS